MRPAEAAARRPIIMSIPSERNGVCSMRMYWLKATMAPTVS